MTKARMDDYKLVVVCKARYCDIVKEYMKENGFRVGKSNTSLGDHYGTMSFKSEEEANRAADSIFHKFSTKIHQIAVLPDTDEFFGS